MPEIWDDRKFLTTYRAVLGGLANFAIQQSPYPIPGNLAAALREFDTIFKAHVDEVVKNTGVIATSCTQLITDVGACIAVCPLIIAWNIPRRGSQRRVPFSKYYQSDPDYNFVDLGALARNVAQSITIVEKYDNEYGAGMQGINEADV